MWAVAHSERPASKPRVLYVDDDADHLKLYSRTLRDEFDVVTAQGAEQGLRALEQQGPFAVVVSDMRMPHMNGTDFLARVRTLDAYAVRILMTGDADMSSAVDAVNHASAFRYLTKPCAREQLAEALRSATLVHKREVERDGIGRKLQLLQPNASVDLDGKLYLGQLIAERYEILSVLGAGGTAVVLRCMDRVLDMEVGLKLFSSTMDSTSQHRLKRELLLTRELSHPNITRCYDIGLHAGAPFITMELLSGTDLRSKIGSPEMSPKLAIDCLIQACRGLEHAHGLGVTHRDIKPDNLFLGDDGTLHVMDFGLAKKQRSMSVTQPNMMGGTLQYIAPEQIEDLATVTHSVDIYALGIVGYELLTGKCPFDYDDPRVVLASHLTVDPKPLSALMPGLPRELDHIFATALAKHPEHRYRSCSSFAHALEQVCWP